MTDANGCQGRSETIAALVLGELEAPEADEVKEHIDSCENCRLLYKALTEEEESVESAFKAVDGRSKAVGDSLVARYETGLHKSSSEAAVLRRLWDGLTMPKRVAELAAAALIIIGVFIGIHLFGGSNVAWADVAERFRTVPFFSATIYIKDYALLEPRQLELWMGPGGRARMRIGYQVIFGKSHEALRAFDIRRRKEVEPDTQAVELLDMLGDMEEYSLETVIRSISGGTLVDVTPLVNADAVISEDMVVFDAVSNGDPEWVRVHALRESRLPVGIRIWDPRKGKSVDVFISYFKQQPDEFFDSKAFLSRLTDRNCAEADLAHIFLKDPGGQSITAKDLLERGNSEMPGLSR